MKAISYAPNYFVCQNGFVYSSKRGKPVALQGVNSGDGYLVVTLWINSCGYQASVHRLVALEFLDNFDNLPCVNHKDGNKSNNSVANLEWCCHKANTQHAIDAQLIKQNGVDSHYAKLTEDQVTSIRSYPRHNGYQKHLAQLYNVAIPTISHIINRRTWKHLP